MRLLLPLLLLATLVTPACSGIEEKICAKGEVAIERGGGGRSCEKPADDDPDCPSGEILLKNPDAGLQGCIPDGYTEDSYTEKYKDRLTEIPTPVPTPVPTS